MTVSELSGKVQTVLGPIEPEDLGITLPHEHLLVDLTCTFLMPEEATERAYIHAPVTMDILGSLKPRSVHPYLQPGLTRWPYLPKPPQVP